MALKQEEFENTFVMMDKRNILQKLGDAVLSKIGKEPKFLPEITKDNERQNMILNSRRIDEISKNINSQINSKIKDRMANEMKDEDVVKYENEVEEISRRNEFVNQYRNVLSKQPLSARDEVNKSIIDKAKKSMDQQQKNEEER